MRPTCLILLLFLAAYTTTAKEMIVDPPPLNRAMHYCCQCHIRMDKDRCRIGVSEDVATVEIHATVGDCSPYHRTVVNRWAIEIVAIVNIHYIYIHAGCYYYQLTNNRATIEWGDGSPNTEVEMTGGTPGSFTRTHTYSSLGCFSIVVQYGRHFPYCGDYLREIIFVNDN